MTPSAPAPATRDDAHRAALVLLEWIEARDWRGHDPFDLLLSPLAAPLRPFRWPSVAWVQLGRRSPVDLRGLLGVPPHENPKALALGVEACLALKRAGVPGAPSRVPALLARLLASQGDEGGWGYPFPWANRHFRVPAGTSSGVVTAFATRAILAGLDAGALPEGVGADAVRDRVLRAAAFVHGALRRIETAHGPLLSYTPLDTRGVHNASVLAAAVLARGSMLGGDTRWADTARTVAATTLAAQRPDGHWPYGTSRRDAFVDAYHTGYVLEALAEVDRCLGIPGAWAAVDRGLTAWREAFLAGPAVGPAPGRSHPVDLHAVAAAILTLLAFEERLDALPGHTPARDEALRLAGWALSRARRSDGAFVSTWSPGRVNPVPYLRWVQAWMLRALSALASP